MIRLAKEKDTKDIWEAHIASIREVCSEDYSNEQIAGWSSFSYSHEHWVKTMKKDHVLVYEKNDKVHGFCHSGIIDDSTAEIYGFYLSPLVVGKGVGMEMLSSTLKYFKDLNNISKVKLIATRTAKSFYEKAGFIVTGPEFQEPTRGIMLECIPMELAL
ncbi:hypothetical protein A9Q84_10660 [Halobacteriovorax marinus]|uniref:N-acetyltransferase domain-containing protein n=1 Tax=Halobacteriovorax marinus TaxID=97084 RepID=A0A1Y5F7D5_9BACT|nr:hypothetical protein A9Q84_10660 [Halobacteriovorax marinus]